MLFNSNKMLESEALLPAKAQTTTNVTGEEQWPGIDSSFRLVVVAALRSKQLLHGSTPRIEPDARKRRNTSIALEEVKRGLVPFTITTEDHKKIGDELKSDGLL